jgi:hypothetical protein
MADDEIQDEPRPQRPRPPRRPRDDDYDDVDVRVRRPDAVETLIPYRNPTALIAYYAGVFSFIPCFGLAAGPAALVLGIIGIRYRKRNPTAGGLGHAIAGIVMGSLTSLANWGVVLALGIAAAMGALK